MAKKSKKIEDEIKNEVVTNCDQLTVYSQFEVAKRDFNNVNNSSH